MLQSDFAFFPWRGVCPLASFKSLEKPPKAFRYESVNND